MLKHACLAAALLAAPSLFAEEPAQTMIVGRSDLKSVYEISEIRAQRTTLTRENKFPSEGNVEAGGFYAHDERMDIERDILGVSARYGLWETVTVGAEVPVVLDSKFNGKSNSGLGDVVLGLDLLAYQDIFRYPFVIPHAEVSLPTGDEDKGLGSGETIINLGISVGTKVFDQLTYVVDASYAFNGASQFADSDDNQYSLSGSVVWDISDRFAVLAEGRLYEKLDFMDDNPYEIKGGLVYRLSRNLQLAGYGGKVDGGMGMDYDQAMLRLNYQF
ncbi:MAG TPA: transporter [Kiritimatiellia bacterium]|nr:transporter [Kiritimatiellia bacterium]HMO97706.1 transporter [Kiritimatiellia bacterium]HMP97092.1 transporter [Kiritimatiellia bacterium]